MENMNVGVSDDYTIANAKFSTLWNLKQKLGLEKLHFVKQSETLEILSADYDSKLVKRNPSNEKAFLSLRCGLKLLDINLETTESKLSLIEQEILSMENNVCSATDSDINLFLDHAKGAINLLEEVDVKTKIYLDILMDCLKEFIVIDES